jgi:hypothetical protein
MFRIGFVGICLVMIACNHKKTAAREEGDFSFENFSGQFKAVSLPYQLSDTGFLRNRDTATIRSAAFARFIPDSLRSGLFGKGNKVRYVSLAKLPDTRGTSFYIVKGIGGTKRAALLLAFNKDSFGGVLPFLIPDNDPSTSQQSIIDKSYSISKNISQRKPNNAFSEGKDVYEYYADAHQFSLILTNPLNNENREIVNPIDTFSRKHKFAGDYIRDKKNYVSVRDGRHPNQLTVFMHLEKDGGGCSGELKGELLLTSATTAIYRQGGDPCVLSFRFASSSVTVREDEGCGAHRGLDCSFNGTFARKKLQKPKTGSKKK